MLSAIRNHADSWLIKTILWLIVFAFIGTIFYSWGMGGASTSGSGSGAVATVDGAKISAVEYERTFNNLINFYREQFRSQFSEDLIQKLDLKHQALDALIQKKLLLLEADKQNLRVSDSEVVSRIRNFDAFKKDKVFDQNLYDGFLRYRRLTPSEFEESQREALLIEKMEGFIKTNVKVSENEVDKAFEQENEKVKINYVMFPHDHFKSSKKVTEEEIRSFYERNKKRFEIPEQIKVEFVKITSKNYEGEIDIRDEDIEDYYKTKIADFRVPKQFTAAHILFTIEPPKDDSKLSAEEAAKEAEEAAKKEADEVLKKIRSGADFGELAKKHSDDPTSGEKGGGLGEFPKGMMVDEFEATLEKMKPGDISDPVRTSFGFHIIRLDEVKEGRTKPLEEVKETVVQKLTHTKSRQKARRIAKHIHRSAKENRKLAQAATDNQLEVQVTPLISRNSHVVPEIGLVPEFFNLAFTLEDNQVSEPLHTFEASFVLKVVGREKPYIPELSDADVKKLAEEKVQEEKDLASSSKKFEDVGKELGQGSTNLDSVAKKLGLEVKSTPLFNRSDSIPGIGNVQEVKAAAFELEKGKSGSVSVRNKYYLLQIQDREKAGASDPETLRNLTARLQIEKGNIVFQEWMENLKETSEILIDKTQL